MTNNRLDIFVNRMKKININIELMGNFPWVYIIKINGKVIKEKFNSEHGFVVCILPIRECQNIACSNIGKIFQLIRKYN